MFITSLLLSLVAPAHADSAAQAPAPGVTVNMPAFGVTIVFTGECTPAVAAGRVSPAKAGQFAIDLAKAQAICVDNKAIADRHALDLEIAANRSTAEMQLISAGAIPVMNGGSVSYESDGVRVHFSSGPAAELHEFGTAVAALDPSLAYSGLVDPNLQQGAGLARLAGIPTGYDVGSTTAPTAQCGTPAQCDDAVKRLSMALAKK